MNKKVLVAVEGTWNVSSSIYLDATEERLNHNQEAENSAATAVMDDEPFLYSIWEEKGIDVLRAQIGRGTSSQEGG
ncbi:hypothetical protein Nepgr_024286 [Nepenthes gracilis]|uniref:Uncharacterized protein n=1 Tax=Nepenthes gracilis TaxID=150966 RepID=A0AAD3T2K3_NEPGR|nr:hypothetical protein Nepgr_024286 [Nepenthes gracilis]